MTKTFVPSMVFAWRPNERSSVLADNNGNA